MSSSYSSYGTDTSERTTPQAIDAPTRRHASMSVDGGQALGRSFIYSSYRPSGLEGFAAGTPAVHSTSSVHEETANFAGVGVDEESSGSEALLGETAEPEPEGEVQGEGEVEGERSYWSAGEPRATKDSKSDSFSQTSLSHNSLHNSFSQTTEPPSESPLPEAPLLAEPPRTSWQKFFARARKITRDFPRDLPAWKQTGARVVGYVPAVFLGVLMNILDALSYGMIMFPLSEPCFKDMGPAGLSMFYVSTIVSQLVFSLGGSAFKSGIGSEMIEVTPFFHKMASSIMVSIGEDNKDAVVATTIVTMAFSSVVTGLCFGLLGKFRLGKLVGFFL